MLNPSQQKAVNAVSGPVRIIAGAGTGKTIIRPGYDGEYGVIKLFNPDELVPKAQMRMF